MPSDKLKDPRRFAAWMQWAAVKAFRAKGEWVLAEEFLSHAGYLAELRKFRAFRHSLAAFPAIAVALEAPPPGTWRLAVKTDIVEATVNHITRTKRMLYCRVVEVDAEAEAELKAERSDALDSIRDAIGDSDPASS